MTRPLTVVIAPDSFGGAMDSVGVADAIAAHDPKETMHMTAPTLDAVTDIDAATHRRLGVALFNHVWTLLETPDRTPAQVDEMIHAAHASRFHWERAEDRRIVNLARGEWQCSRVYAVLGRGDPAVWHAKRCLEYLEQAGDDCDDWDPAAAAEAMARAYAVAGDPGAASDWKRKATVALDAIVGSAKAGQGPSGPSPRTPNPLFPCIGGG